MGIGASIFLIASGAILNWGVETSPDEVNLNTIGVILMLVGGFGLLLSLLLLQDWQPWTRRNEDLGVTRREVFIEEEPVVRRSLVEEDPAVRRSAYTTRRSTL